MIIFILMVIVIGYLISNSLFNSVIGTVNNQSYYRGIDRGVQLSLDSYQYQVDQLDIARKINQSKREYIRIGEILKGGSGDSIDIEPDESTISAIMYIGGISHGEAYLFVKSVYLKGVTDHDLVVSEYVNSISHA